MLHVLPQTFKPALQQIRFLQVAQILNLRHLLQKIKEKRATKQVCLAPRGKTPNMNFFLLSAFSLFLFKLVPRVFSFSSIGKREDPGVEVEKK